MVYYVSWLLSHLKIKLINKKTIRKYINLNLKKKTNKLINTDCENLSDDDIDSERSLKLNNNNN